jgi:hypothetical protein
MLVSECDCGSNTAQMSRKGDHVVCSHCGCVRDLDIGWIQCEVCMSYTEYGTITEGSFVCDECDK